MSRTRTKILLYILAVQEGSRELVELLLANEVDISLQNDSGETAFQMAVRRNNSAIQELLKNFNEKSKKRYIWVRYGTTDLSSEIQNRLDQEYKKRLEGGVIGAVCLSMAPPMSTESPIITSPTDKEVESFWESAMGASKAVWEKLSAVANHPLTRICYSPCFRKIIV